MGAECLNCLSELFCHSCCSCPNCWLCWWVGQVIQTTINTFWLFLEQRHASVPLTSHSVFDSRLHVPPPTLLCFTAWTPLVYAIRCQKIVHQDHVFFSKLTPLNMLLLLHNSGTASCKVSEKPNQFSSWKPLVLFGFFWILFYYQSSWRLNFLLDH